MAPPQRQCVFGGPGVARSRHKNLRGFLDKFPNFEFICVLLQSQTLKIWKLSVNFTREPIIETVITPREGCKLVVRSSKGNSQEDYFVDAVEVVSFGHSFFFRSTERPKSFLVPVSDYEIIELKETRMVLKNVSTERSIKIGGGREAAPPRPHRESASETREPREEGQSEERNDERAPD